MASDYGFDYDKQYAARTSEIRENVRMIYYKAILSGKQAESKKQNNILIQL